jgi:hypothetical protein
MNERVRAVLAIAFVFAILAMLAFARGEPQHGTPKAAYAVIVTSV